MTSLEKKEKVKEVLNHMCRYGDGCPECTFFEPEDATDGKYFCSIRDFESRTPDEEMWDMSSAVISDQALVDVSVE